MISFRLIYISLFFFGEISKKILVDSGKRKLEGQGNLFERAQRDSFGIECVELGAIKRITIGHDGSGFGSGWFLDKGPKLP